jgi:hypothetical protein
MREAFLLPGGGPGQRVGCAVVQGSTHIAWVYLCRGFLPSYALGYRLGGFGTPGPPTFKVVGIDHLTQPSHPGFIELPWAGTIVAAANSAGIPIRGAAKRSCAQMWPSNHTGNLSTKPPEHTPRWRGEESSPGGPRLKLLLTLPRLGP